MGDGMARVRGWVAAQGWTPFPFQEATWAAYEAGESGLVHVPTGAGKTYAAYLAALAELLDAPSDGLAVVYVTPLRALARDIALAMQRPVKDLGLSLRVETRTGDTSSSVRAKQRGKLPQVLITTPESLTVLLSYEDAPQRFHGMRLAVIDEWHELISTKRGTQTELALARLRRFSPAMRTWALSATLRSPDEGAQCVVGTDRPYRLVRGDFARRTVVDTIFPERVERFPWAGRLGLAMLPRVLDLIADGRTSIAFTNTRSQAEKWYRAIADAQPEWADRVALHHGSIDREERERVEAGLKSGEITTVVATSSLDLGVDFAPVDRVLQIGSPKGIARLLQRAGRSAHRPNEAAHIICVPTHALELVEFAAARDALGRQEIEPRKPLEAPLDVLVQHLVTCAMGGGFVADDLYAEVRSAWSYRHLTAEAFEWALAMVEHGGATLRAYEQHHKVLAVDGTYLVSSPRVARLHRLAIGTITAEATMEIRYQTGGRIGTIEEDFIARLRQGDRFTFAGRALEFVRVRDMVAHVKRASVRAALTPIWMGARFPMSTSLGGAVRERLDDFVRHGAGGVDEMVAATPILGEQQRLSVIPLVHQVLVERWKSREGHHLYLYPFEGRLAHQALASLLAYRSGKRRPATFSLTVNDYGIEFLSAEVVTPEDLLSAEALSAEDLLADIAASVNMGELARRQFRDIARISGLVFAGYPGAPKGTRQVQLTSSLVFDVFTRYDPGNLLVVQAHREVLEQQFELTRLEAAVQRLATAELVVRDVKHPTPLGFPLFVDRLGSRLTTEDLITRVERMIGQWQD
ncbi:MAG: ligase-associated DNA damage response DEXH box helicase [Cytophagaceae bacterium]|nr:ligase-associated DNA damage response DEXH box helicase [Gemmatimonadaceae bacterium]